MDSTSLQLLKMLGSGVRPTELPGLSGKASGASAPGGVSFADLLKQAQDGTLVSKLPVTISSDEAIALSDEQLARVSVAADKAEAAGIKTALLKIDGQSLVLDVHSRQITGTADGCSGIVSGVDGVMDLGNMQTGIAGAGDPLLQAQGVLAGAKKAQLKPPASSLSSSSSLLELLSKLQTPGAGE